MQPLTDEQFLLLRREIGDTGGENILSSVELNLAYQQAGGDLKQTRLIALRWMRAHYAKARCTTKDDDRCYAEEMFNHYSDLVASIEADIHSELVTGSIDLCLGYDS
jgi:hypothetical protein